YVEHRYVCSECSHLAPSLEEALLHHQQHHQHHQYQLLGLTGDYQTFTALPETNQYQCLECGQLLVSPGQLLEHQELHLKLFNHEADASGVAVKPHPAAQIHYECVECKALFTSQDLWLAHRQSHRLPPASADSTSPSPPQSQALVDLEHSYQKPEEDDDDDTANTDPTANTHPGGDTNTVQLLLYECGECLQLFQSPKDFLEHQTTHLTIPALNGGANEAPPGADHSYEFKEDCEEPPPPPPPPPPA
ncbi:ZN574 protein, partial [Chordeiles acutipennis]|nr:ZN574 protein [Chordeiles acutipennis]